MADIKKRHKDGCLNVGLPGGDCGCPWRLDHRPLGMKGPRRRLEFPTKKAAERFCDETSHRVSRGECVEPAKVPNFRDAAETWFRSKVDEGFRPSHVIDLRSRLDRHILPRIGAERRDRIGVTAVKKLRADLRSEGYRRTP
jgi:hypothetical protein